MATYTVTHPDGSVSTRNTKRIYTHAVVVRDNEGWGVVRWSGSATAAEKGRREFASWGTWDLVEVVEVDR